MLIESLVFLGVITGVFLAAAAIAAVSRLATKSVPLSLAAGTLMMPLLLCASLVYWLLTMKADDPAPGNVLIGNGILLAVITPTAFIASHYTNRLLTRRASPNDR